MKKRQVILYIVVMLILLTTSVYATISGELGIKATASSSVIRPGDEFSITLSLKNLETTGKIKAVEGYIDVNEDILDDLTIENIKTNTDGKVEIDKDNILTIYDATEISSSSETGIIFNTDPASKEGDYKIVINFAKPIDTDKDLVTLTFKVKDNAEPGDYSSAIVYKIFKVFSEDAKEKQELTNKGIKIVISKPGTSSNKTDNNAIIDEENVVENKPENRPENKPENKNETQNVPENKPENKPDSPTKNESQNPQGSNPQDQNPSGGQSKSGTQKDDTVAQGNLPKAGYKIVIFPIIIIAILGFVFYRKYSKYDNYRG